LTKQGALNRPADSRTNQPNAPKHVATVRPFRALRPAGDNASRVAAPPYDVISTDEARALAHGNSDSFLHVSRPEISLPDDTDEHADEVYARGRANLAEFEARGVLRSEAEPRLYLYAQRMGAHRQIGLVACVPVQDYLDGTIKKHENTRPDKEDDRTRHIDTLGAHDEPVFLTYRSVPAIDAAVRDAARVAPAVDFTSPDGVRHALWVLPREAGEGIATLFRAVPALYVAGCTRCARGVPASTTRSSPSCSRTTKCRSWRTTAWCATPRAARRPNCSRRSAR
jgi:uncharacterized protein (DUF1015 family)